IESITRYDPVDEYTTATTMIWEVTFSEDVTGVDVTADFGIGISGGSFGGAPVGTQAQVSANVYRMTLNFVFSGDIAGVRLVPYPAATFEDTSGNAMVDFTVINSNEGYQYDTRAPTLTITTAENFPTNETTFPLTLTFSEPVTGFDASDLNLATG